MEKNSFVVVDFDSSEKLVPSKELIKQLVTRYGISRSHISSFLYDMSKGKIDGACRGSWFRICCDFKYLEQHDVLTHLYIDRDDIGYYTYSDHFYCDVRSIIDSLFSEAEAEIS